MRSVILFCFVALGVAWAGIASAQDEVTTVDFIVQPVSEPSPALKYRLLPTYLEEKPGNAAPLYLKVLVPLGAGADNQRAERVDSLRTLEPELMPKDEVRSLLNGYQHLLKEITLAARREDCDWEIPFRDGNPVAILLPEAQESRQATRVLALKARLQIAERDFDGALETIKTGFAMADDISKGQTLIHDLVAVANNQMLLDQLETISRTAGAPSLYWALTTLPDPLVEMRDALEMEQSFIELTFPELQDLSRARSPEQWERLYREIQTEMQMLSDSGTTPGVQTELVNLSLAVATYPRAKKYLTNRGYAEAEVEQMPVPRVLLLHALKSYHELRDDYFKWAYVDLSEWAGQQDERALFSKSEASHAAIPFRDILPAARAAIVAPTRLQRRVAALRIVEAIRLHAKSNGGKLPEKLDEITIVPIPHDPMLDQPFGYERSGDTAILSAEAPAGTSKSNTSIRYRIQIQQGGK